ncbi:MAG: 3-dehydroquinate synthase [Pirellulales bacterium]
MPVVNVSLGPRSYPISIGSGTLEYAGQFLVERVRATHVVAITDEHVEALYADALLGSLSKHVARVDLISVPAGETSKSIEAAGALWEQMAEYGTDRKSAVVALGGGVVGDLAGFVAATYARGLPFLQIPTTLLAQVDSSVGGKTGINLSTAKNLVGSFWQPRGVLIDTHTLRSQGERDYRGGLAEVVKYGVILDDEFFDYLETHTAELLARDPATLEEIVGKSCELKAFVVSRDEREETGLRAVLNYGHTFAHAFETVSGYGELTHGEAVTIGMTCAARLAADIGRIPNALVERQTKLLSALGLPTTAPALEHASLLNAMAKDKKVEHGRLKFVLPTKLGHVELVDGVTSDQVCKALTACGG